MYRSVVVAARIMKSSMFCIDKYFNVQKTKIETTIPSFSLSQSCLTKAAKKEPRNVAIRTELRNLSKLAHESGVDGAAGTSVTGGGSELTGSGSPAEASRGVPAEARAVGNSKSGGENGTRGSTSSGSSSVGFDGAGGGKRRRDDGSIGQP